MLTYLLARRDGFAFLLKILTCKVGMAMTFDYVGRLWELDKTTCVCSAQCALLAVVVLTLDWQWNPRATVGFSKHPVRSSLRKLARQAPWHVTAQRWCRDGQTQHPGSQSLCALGARNHGEQSWPGTSAQGSHQLQGPFKPRGCNGSVTCPQGRVNGPHSPGQLHFISSQCSWVTSA